MKKFNSYQEEHDTLVEIFEKYEGKCEYQQSDYCSEIGDDCGPWTCPYVMEELEEE